LGRFREPYGLVVSSVRARLAAGACAPGEPLPINLLARDLAVSQTPVREALAQLAGEGLIERTPSGYAAPRLAAEDLADLYRLMGVYLEAATSGPLPTAADPAGDPRQALSSALDAAVAAQGNDALSRAYARTRARLAPFSLREAAVLDDVGTEALRLLDQLNNPLRRIRRAALARYLQRRILASRALIAAAAAPPDMGRI
jgi:DNA-binding GntR family transcriptional regulator